MEELEAEMAEARRDYWKNPRSSMCPHGEGPSFINMYEVPPGMQDCRIEIDADRHTVCATDTEWSFMLWSVEKISEHEYFLEIRGLRKVI